MDLNLGPTSDDEEMIQSLDKGKRICSARHDRQTTSRLEEIFQENPFPTKQQMAEISKEVGLELRQVKYWFQNRRTYERGQAEKTINDELRIENERLLAENIKMKKALKTMLCKTCKGSAPIDNDEEHDTLEELRSENARLKAEQEKWSKLILRHLKDQQQTEEQPRLLWPSSSKNPSSFGDNPKLGIGSSSGSTKITSRKMTGIEMAIMLEVVKAAKKELLKLLMTDEPLWVKSQVDGGRVLVEEHYDKLFPRVNHFNGAEFHVESSKEARIVKHISAAQLVDMFLDQEKWNNFFSTIVTNAQTIEVLQGGSSENRSGALLLMYEEMHVLSHMAPAREFYIIRYCERIKERVWLIVDLSYNYLKEENHFHTWKRPSGCMIQELSDSVSQVIWVEHVEIEDNNQAHDLYRDIVDSTIAFGAKRWLMELQRMCSRLSSIRTEWLPSYDSGVVSLSEGTRNVLALSHRMVKSFWKGLAMTNGMEIPQFIIGDDDNKEKIYIQKSKDPYKNDMVIITIASSFSLPLPSHALFEFFKNPKNRFKWDALCGAKPWHQVAHITYGNNPNSYISIVRALKPVPEEDDVMIIQESFVDSFGALVVYSPVNIPELQKALNGHDSSNVSLLPYGIIISEDNTIQSLSNEEDNKARVSMLTMTFQMLMVSEEVEDMECLPGIISFMTTSIKGVKNVFLPSSG